MADARRLAEVGIVPRLAKEIASQIDAGVGNARRLAELSMVPGLAGELASQITSNTASARRLAELGMVPVAAKETATQILGGGVPDDGIRNLILLFGNSNAKASAEDQASYTGWVDDADIVALNSSFSFAKVVPLTFTGMAGGINNGDIDVALHISRQMRLAEPNKRVFILKNAVTGSKQITQWASPGGVYFSSTKTFLDTAVAAIVAAGFTPRIWAICQLGENDANTTDYPSFPSAFRTMVTDILSGWGVHRLMYGRLASPAGTSMRKIRTIEQDWAYRTPEFYLNDLDGAQIGLDGTHFNLSGVQTMAERYYAIISGVSMGLRIPFFKEDFTDNGNAWTLNAGWVIGGDGYLTATAATSSARMQYLGLETDQQYRIRAMVQVTSGQVRCRFNGGTDVLGAAISATGLLDVTLTTVTGNINFDFLPPSGSFTGRISALTIERL